MKIITLETAFAASEGSPQGIRTAAPYGYFYSRGRVWKKTKPLDITGAIPVAEFTPPVPAAWDRPSHRVGLGNIRSGAAGRGPVTATAVTVSE